MPERLRRLIIPVGMAGLALIVALATATRGQERPGAQVLDTPDKAYLLFPVRITDRSTAAALTFDPERDEPATISYRLTRDGTIRVRVGWRHDERLVLRTLMDWTHQEFGPHEVRWDGRDASGNVVDNRHSLIAIEGDDPQHLQHEAASCHEMRLDILAPPSDSNLVDLSEVVVRVGDATSYGQEAGFDLRVYVDYELVEESVLEPNVRTFNLPPHPVVEPGEHLLTLNLDDGQGHLGVAGLRFRTSTDRAELGRRVYEREGCDACHEVDHAAWLEAGPGLRFIGSRRPVDYLRLIIADPKAAIAAAQMPKEALSPVEVDALLEYMLSLRRPAHPPREGRRIYLEEGCADCHDTPGESGAMLGPHLVGIGALRGDAYLGDAILRPGKLFPGTAMPPTLLGPRELAVLIELLRNDTDMASLRRERRGSP